KFENILDEMKKNNINLNIDSYSLLIKQLIIYYNKKEKKYNNKYYKNNNSDFDVDNDLLEKILKTIKDNIKFKIDFENNIKKYLKGDFSIYYNEVKHYFS